MFAITEGKGFQMGFENGITLSVQFGVNNYCDKKDTGGFGCEKIHPYWTSETAEIAVRRGGELDGELLAELIGEEWIVDEDGYPNRDTVEGWVSVDDVGKIITKIMEIKGD